VISAGDAGERCAPSAMGGPNKSTVAGPVGDPGIAVDPLAAMASRITTTSRPGW
jgi:hypothetical protein